MVAERPSLPESSDVGDFIAPYFDVIFYRASSVEEQQEVDRFISRSAQEFATDDVIGLTLRLNSRNGEELTFRPDNRGPELWKIRSHLTIEAKAATAYKATLTLTPTYEMALELLESPVIQYGSLMALEWGYMNTTVGKGTPLRDRGLFTITQPSVRFGKQISFQITGWDILSVAAKSLTTRKSYAYGDSAGQFKNHLEVVKNVITRTAPGLKIDDSGVRKESDLRKAQTSGGVIQTTRDWDFIGWLLASNDATFRMSGTDKVEIMDFATVARGDPTYRLLWYENPSAGTDIPMISFDANSLPTLFASDGARGFFVVKNDPNDPTSGATSGEIVEIKNGTSAAVGTDRTQASEGGASKKKTQTVEEKARSLFGPKDPERAAGQTLMISSEHPTANNAEEVVVDGYRRVANTHADVVIPGHPSILPLMLVEIPTKSLSVFGGVYRVLKVVHDIGRGYTTKLRLFRDSSTGDPTAAEHPKTKAKTSKHTTPPSASSTVVVDEEEPRGGNGTNR